MEPMVLAQLHGQEATAYCTWTDERLGIDDLGCQQSNKMSYRYTPSVTDGPVGTGSFLLRSIQTFKQVHYGSRASGCLK
jgi:hypothetical protein